MYVGKLAMPTFFAQYTGRFAAFFGRFSSKHDTPVPCIARGRTKSGRSVTTASTQTPVLRSTSLPVKVSTESSFQCWWWGDSHLGTSWRSPAQDGRSELVIRTNSIYVPQ